MQQLIVDADGELFINTGSFPFVDPTNGVRFEQGAQVRVKRTPWITGQPVLKLVEEAPVEVAKPTKAAK